MKSKRATVSPSALHPLRQKVTNPAMRDVAEAAGVSIATVSLALAGKQKVSDSTREKVLRVAGELGYRKNPYVAALMESRRRKTSPGHEPVIAFLTFHDDAKAWQQAPYIDYFTPAKEEAERLGYRLETFWAMDPSMPADRLSKVLYSRGISGILLNAPPRRRMRLEMDWDLFSIVALGAGLQYPTVHRVASDNFHIAREAIKQFDEVGLKRIGLLCRQESDDRLQHRWLGAYMAECYRRNMATDIPPFMDNKFTPEDVKLWVERHQLEGFVGTLRGDWIQKLKDTGLKIPEDVRYLGITLLNEDPTVTGFIEQIELVSKTAIQQLIGMLHRHETGLPETPCESFLLGRWHSGASF